MKEKVADFDSLLSPLEGDVLKILWPDKKMLVREIHTKLKSKVALSSVAVILDRLYDKQIVAREVETARGGARYIYYPTQDKNAFEKSVIDKTVNQLIKAFGPNAVSYFNERFRKR